MKFKKIDFSGLETNVELALIKKLTDFPDTIFESSKNSEPHILSDYCVGNSRFIP